VKPSAGLNEDVLCDVLAIGDEIGIRESENSIPAGFQKRGSHSIVPRISRLRVLRSIELDDQFRPMAGKVRHIRTNWRLPAKVQSLVSEYTQDEPKPAFGICRHAP